VTVNLYPPNQIARELEAVPAGSVGAHPDRRRGWIWIVRLPSGELGALDPARNEVVDGDDAETISAGQIDVLLGVTYGDRGLKLGEPFVPSTVYRLLSGAWEEPTP